MIFSFIFLPSYVNHPRVCMCVGSVPSHHDDIQCTALVTILIGIGSLVQFSSVVSMKIERMKQYSSFEILLYR